MGLGMKMLRRDLAVPRPQQDCNVSSSREESLGFKIWSRFLYKDFVKGFLLVCNKTCILAKSHLGVSHQPVSSRVKNCRYGEVRFRIMQGQTMTG